MVPGRRAICGCGSALLHAAALLLARTGDEPPPLLEEWETIDVIAYEDSSAPLAFAPASSEPRPDPGHEAATDHAHVPSEAERASRPRLRARAPHDATAMPVVADESPASGEATEFGPHAVAAIAPPRLRNEKTVPEVTRVGTGAGTPNGRGSGSAEEGPDHAAYGAEIVRIVHDEIERNPIPGLGRGDAIQVLLRIRPNGRLARSGTGRFGFADVLHSSLGPLRTRNILRRIEQASTRFPPHPQGLRKPLYVVDVTVRFRLT
jgi:hypothetical protein